MTLAQGRRQVGSSQFILAARKRRLLCDTAEVSRVDGSDFIAEDVIKPNK